MIVVVVAHSSQVPLTIVLLGESGVGKSALGNVLLGRSHNFTGYGLGCFKEVSHSFKMVEPATKFPCMDSGHLLGNTSLPILNILDTPGFGFHDTIDDRSIDHLVSYLKKKVNSTTAFLLLFKGVEKRFTKTTHEWLKVIENIFGDKLWDHVVLVATHWHYSLREIEKRLDSNPVGDESHWSYEMNKFIQEYFNHHNSIQTFFIDSYHNEDALEIFNFYLYCNRLLTYLNTVESDFQLDDINTVLTDLGQMRSKVSQLESDIQVKSLKLNDLIILKKNLLMSMTSLHKRTKNVSHIHILCWTYLQLLLELLF